MFNRIVKLPHRPHEEGIRKIYTHLGLEIPPGTLPANILADMIWNVLQTSLKFSLRTAAAIR